MRELVNLKNFEDYTNVLNEDLIHGEQSICNRAFINGGLITFADGSSVHPKEIVNAVNNALMYLNSEFSRTFVFAKNTLNIIYLAHSKRYKTMAVDKNMNLYLNAGFVFHQLKMDKELIAAVIMHEVFHALFNHIERGTNWLAAQGKSQTPSTWHDTNLAADVEVNQTLVRIGLIEEERLINEIEGIYLKTQSGNRDVVPMEVILNDEEYMNKLRSMCPGPRDPEQGNQESIKTTEEWNNGYKDAWNKIAGLIKKYGYREVWQKLQDAGIINSVGEINDKTTIDDIKAIEYLRIKSIEDYINEGIDSDKGKTYDDGFKTAFSKLIERLNGIMNPQNNEDGGIDQDMQDSGPQYETDLKNEDLDEIELPNDKSKKSNGNGNGLPDNIKSESNPDSDNSENDGDKNQKQNSKDQKQGQGQGQGGEGKDSEDLTDDDINKLANDIEKKTGGGTSTISTQQEISIGGTGSFQEDGLTDDDLKEAGYSQEDIDSINKVRKDNETNNSKARIEKAIEKMRRELPKHSVISKYLNAIEIEANKYKNLWKEILEDFLAKKTRRAGKDTPNGYNDWKRKSRIANGDYGIHHKLTSQDPQDVNVYVDVSGSIDVELLEIIAKSLVVFTQEWEYSGMNICPWASSSNGVFRVEDFYDRSENEITDEILKIVSTGIAQCGGGTDVEAAIDAMIEVVKETLDDDEKDEKDDVHIVITDGYFDYSNVENRIKRAIMDVTHRGDVAEKAPENTFWMIYDAPENMRIDWSREIKKGKLIFINSEVVKNNK